ncbi:MAG: hydantoinase/carbamoylase family amidase [Pseudomonadota bacterium]
MPLNPARFLSDLTALRQIGAVGCGVVRPAYSDADIAARRWLLARIADAGLTPQVDAVGNVFGLAETGGVLLGSHTDTQPEGGWLDGALGVIAGLEVARAARENGGPPISVVSFQDEEGRFGALTGSEVWTGSLSLADADAKADAAGLRFSEARRSLGDLAGPHVPLSRFRAFLEIHIEQGPVLDGGPDRIGIVTAIVGARQLHVTLEGQQNHAGTTPMHLRRDAMQGVADVAVGLRTALQPIVTVDSVWTMGQVTLAPNAPSVVPGKAEFTIQWRDADAARLADMEEAVRETLTRVGADRDLRVTITDSWALAPTQMDPGVVAACSDAAEEICPGAWRAMPSGALHDASNVAAHLPTAMIFVPSIGGISHDFAEDTGEDDLILGLQVLARAAGLV